MEHVGTGANAGTLGARGRHLTHTVRDSKTVRDSYLWKKIWHMEQMQAHSRRERKAPRMHIS